MPPESGHQLLNEERQQNTTDCRQVEVVDHEKAVQAHGRESLHDLASSKYDNVVCHKNGSRLLSARHWSLARHEVELYGRVALDGYERFVEDGP